MKKILWINSLVITATIFTGCSLVPYKNEFQCKDKANGGSCKSMSQIYEDSLLEAENNETKITDLKVENKIIGKTIKKEKEVFKSDVLSNIVKNNINYDFTNQIPLYEKPKIAKMIVTGYLDEDGDWHKQEEIYMKIEKAKFVLPKNQFSIHELEK